MPSHSICDHPSDPTQFGSPLHDESPDAVSVLEVQADIPDVPPYALEDAEFALPTRIARIMLFHNSFMTFHGGSAKTERRKRHHS